MSECITFITPRFPQPRLPQHIKAMMRIKNKARETIIKNAGETYGIDISLPPRVGGYRVPYGFLSLVSVIRNLGFRINYLSQDFLEKKGEWNARFNHSIKISDVFLFTAFTVDYPIVISLIRQIKRINPNSICIVGGPHVTFLDKKAIDDGIDVVVRGDGEETVKELLNNYEKMQNIGGITYRDKYGKIKRTTPRHLANLNATPEPAFDVLPVDFRKNSRIYFFTSRGCPFRCDFCAEGGTPLRSFSINKIEDHLTNISKFFPFYNLLFIADSNFGIRKKREIARMFKKRFDGLYFECQTHPSLMSKSHLKYLTMHNFFSVVFGIESFSDDILSRIRKGKAWTFQGYYNYLKKIKSAIPIRWAYLMLAHPGETCQTAIQTIRRCSTILNDGLLDFTSSKMFVPLPGTAIFSNPKAFGVTILTHDFTKYDRFACPPPYNLSSLSRDEICVLFEILYTIETYHACIEAKMDVVNMNIWGKLRDIVNEHANHKIEKVIKAKLRARGSILS